MVGCRNNLHPGLGFSRRQFRLSRNRFGFWFLGFRLGLILGSLAFIHPASFALVQPVHKLPAPLVGSRCRWGAWRVLSGAATLHSNRRRCTATLLIEAVGVRSRD